MYSVVINFVSFPVHFIPVPGLTQGKLNYGLAMGPSLFHARTTLTGKLKNTIIVITYWSFINFSKDK